MKVIQNSDEVKEFMKKRNIIIFFFMDGCGHCEATRPAWQELSRSRLPYQFAEVESANVSPEFEIQGFPHFHLVDSKGKVRTVDGARSTKSELASALGLNLTKRTIFRPLRTNRSGLGPDRVVRRVRKTRRRAKSFDIRF